MCPSGWQSVERHTAAATAATATMSGICRTGLRGLFFPMARPAPLPAMQRLERIRRNEAMLRQLGVADAAGGLAAAVAAEQAAVQVASGPVRRPPHRPRERRPPALVAAVPVRKSARQRGDRPLTQDEAMAAAAAELNEAVAGVAGDTDLGEAGCRGSCNAGHVHRQLPMFGKDQCAAAGKPTRPHAMPMCAAEHAGLLDLDTYFQLIGQDVSGAIVSGALA